MRSAAQRRSQSHRQQHGQVDREYVRERAYERAGQEEWHRAAALEYRREERGLTLFARETETTSGGTGEPPAWAGSLARGE